MLPFPNSPHLADVGFDGVGDVSPGGRVQALVDEGEANPMTEWPV